MSVYWSPTASCTSIGQSKDAQSPRECREVFPKLARLSPQSLTKPTTPLRPQAPSWVSPGISAGAALLGWHGRVVGQAETRATCWRGVFGQRACWQQATQQGQAQLRSQVPVMARLAPVEMTVTSRTYCHKELVHIGGRLGRCLHKHDARLIHIRLRVLALHLPLDAQICLIAGQGYYNVRVALPLQLLDPRLRPLERLLRPADQGVGQNPVLRLGGRNCKGGSPLT